MNELITLKSLDRQLKPDESVHHRGRNQLRKLLTKMKLQLQSSNDWVVWVLIQRELQSLNALKAVAICYTNPSRQCSLSVLYVQSHWTIYHISMSKVFKYSSHQGNT